MPTTKVTPAMRQYYEMKDAHPDSILFFRMGDFYEMFHEDAKTAAKELGLTLTTRNKSSENPVPLAGIPYHSANKYLAVLTQKGYKIAVCEQTSDPKLPGLVERDVVRVVTPGTSIQDEVLEKNRHNFIVSVCSNETHYSLSAIDVSTGTFSVEVMSSTHDLGQRLYTLGATELVVGTDDFHAEDIKKLAEQYHIISMSTHTLLDDASTMLCNQFHTKNLEGFGIEHEPLAIESSALLLSYVLETQKTDISHITSITRINHSDRMILDETAVRNLELLYTDREGKKEGSVLHHLQQTKTGAGGRLLYHWLLHPLKQKGPLLARQAAVTETIQQSSLRKHIRSLLDDIYDIERLLAKLSLDRANAKDLLALAISIQKGFELFFALKESGQATQLLMLMGKHLEQHLTALKPIEHHILQAISEEAPITITEGGMFKRGYNADLDELLTLQTEGKQWLLNYQAKEQESTGLKTLKVKFNNVFGYFIEVTKSQSDNVPSYYTKKQTLVNAERFITPELKDYETNILTSEERAHKLEYELFVELRKDVLEQLSHLRALAESIAICDVVCAFAEVSYSHRYTKPEFSDKHISSIIKGRHPIVEAQREGSRFVPNHTAFSNEERLTLVTGPNMAGKSTYLRQIALISLFAQIGCYVPAEQATLPLYDRIFTRVGASDNLRKGQSTFMVEMQEAAQILNQATKHSLIILDELGRGTSTYDGLSLAWAICEDLHNRIKAHSIFATHYHELIEVIEELPHAKNVSVSVAEKEDGVVFLHKIVAGGASQSYGIEVAKLAGVPRAVIDQAQEYLGMLEEEHHTSKTDQMSLFSAPECVHETPQSEIVIKLKALDLNNMTPIEALTWLQKQQRDL